MEFSSVPFEGKGPFQYVPTNYNLPGVSAALCPQKNGIWANWRHGVDFRLAPEEVFPRMAPGGKKWIGTRSRKTGSMPNEG
jgi:hypothetical protein